MSDCSSNESESSLPIYPPLYLPSSPPIVKRLTASYERLETMDDATHPKSEPAPTQVHEESKPLPAALRDVHSDDANRPPSAQRVPVDEHVSETDDDDEELDSDPAEPIAEFDWDELHRRYHDAMKECHEHEGQLTAEWNDLMNYFRIWAESGHDHETDRTFKRLKTRSGHVQHSEAQLEHTRNHYTSVVKAFESALNLLKNLEFRG